MIDQRAKSRNPEFNRNSTMTPTARMHSYAAAGKTICKSCNKPIGGCDVCLSEQKQAAPLTSNWFGTCDTLPLPTVAMYSQTHSDQFPVIPDTQAAIERFDNAYVKSSSQVTMHNDGPHDSMNAPSEEVAIPKEGTLYTFGDSEGLPERITVVINGETVPSVAEVQAERGNAYGDPEFNLGGIAQAMTGYLENKWQMKLPSPITEHDVCVFNVQQKLSRMARTPGHADSVLDAHSYLDLAAKAVERG